MDESSREPDGHYSPEFLRLVDEYNRLVGKLTAMGVIKP